MIGLYTGPFALGVKSLVAACRRTRIASPTANLLAAWCWVPKVGLGAPRMLMFPSVAKDQRNSLLFCKVLPHQVELLGWMNAENIKCRSTIMLCMCYECELGWHDFIFLCHILAEKTISQLLALLQTKYNTDQDSKVWVIWVWWYWVWFDYLWHYPQTGGWIESTM